MTKAPTDDEALVQCETAKIIALRELVDRRQLALRQCLAESKIPLDIVTFSALVSVGAVSLQDIGLTVEDIEQLFTLTATELRERAAEARGPES